MPLLDCGPTRRATPRGRWYEEGVAGYRYGARAYRGNVAKFLVRSRLRRGLPPLAPGHLETVHQRSDGLYVVLAKSGGAGRLHSEARCIRKFRQAFAGDAVVLEVYSEREPCKDRHDGQASCEDQLADFLAAWGELGTRTPVRYSHPYPGRIERQAEARHIQGARSAEARRQAMRDAQAKRQREARAAVMARYRQGKATAAEGKDAKAPL